MGTITYRNVVRISKSAYNCHNVDFAIHQQNFTYTVSRACANIYRFALAYYSWQVLRVVGGRLALLQLCMLLACIYLYCTHQLLAQLLHHFLPYISWIAPIHQQCSTFCTFGKIVEFKKYLRGVSDAGTRLLFKFSQEHMDSMKSWAGIEEGKAGRSVCCMMQSVRVLVMCCGIVLHTLVLEVPSCWS